MRSSNLKLAAIVAAIVLVLGALANSVGAQPIVHVLKAHAVTPIRGNMVWTAFGSKVVVMDARNQNAIAEIDFLDTVFDISRSGEYVAVTLPHGVEIWEIGPDGEMAGNPQKAGGVAGQFVRATIAGEFVVGIDKDDNIHVVEWRKGVIPTDPCPFKGGCPNKANSIFLPVLNYGCEPGPNDPCAEPPPIGPTRDPGEEPPTPGHGPVVPTRTPQPCGYPPCNAAEAAAQFGR